jgi:hypothetical protein
MAWIPEYSGTDNLRVDYFISQIVEEVVADILLLAGIFSSEEEKDAWLMSSYVTPTNEKISRVYFSAGTTAFEAVRLLAEVVLYDFYFDFEGNPIFRPKDTDTVGDIVDELEEEDVEGYSENESDEELHTHVIVKGEGYGIHG